MENNKQSLADWRGMICLIMITGCELADLDDHLHGFLHALDADELVRAVEVDTPSEDIGTGKTLEG